MWTLRASAAAVAASLLAACAAPPARVAPAKARMPSAFEPEAVRAYAAAKLAEQQIEGAALVVVKDGRVALAAAFGRRRAGEAMTLDTAFGIGSVTKQFTCAAALVLEQEGKLSLDDKVSRWEPTLTRAGDVTLDDLGAHVAGYPDYYPLDFVDRRMARPTPVDAIVQRYATQPLQFEPRTRWSYSNTGFLVLARAAERASGEPFADLLRSRLFQPAGMEHAALAPPPDAPGVATGYTSFALGPPEPATPEARDWLHGAGGIVASAPDVARWDLALMDGKILSPASFRKLTTPRRLTDGRSTEYGCGVGVRTLQGETVLHHGGAVSGFLAYNAFVPRTRSAVVLLVNGETGDPGALHREILESLLAENRRIPAVRGAPTKEVARAIFRQLQAGTLDRAQLGEEISAYYSPERLRAAAPRLAALGEPTDVTADPPRERGGLEVTRVVFTFPTRTLDCVVYRAPDGTVEQLLVYPR